MKILAPAFVFLIIVRLVHLHLGLKFLLRLLCGMEERLRLSVPGGGLDRFIVRGGLHTQLLLVPGSCGAERDDLDHVTELHAEVLPITVLLQGMYARGHLREDVAASAETQGASSHVVELRRVRPVRQCEPKQTCRLVRAARLRSQQFVQGPRERTETRAHPRFGLHQHLIDGHVHPRQVQHCHGSRREVFHVPTTPRTCQGPRQTREQFRAGEPLVQAFLDHGQRRKLRCARRHRARLQKQEPALVTCETHILHSSPCRTFALAGRRRLWRLASFIQSTEGRRAVLVHMAGEHSDEWPSGRGGSLHGLQKQLSAPVVPAFGPARTPLVSPRAVCLGTPSRVATKGETMEGPELLPYGERHMQEQNRGHPPEDLGLEKNQLLL
mmetsp:Transcript_25399/g.70707  ORF Transcript_25399/g.70707 Transcript_25399/m.70707 type:complete len:383 (+) Transcript_25399:303-1451(+)